MLTMSVYVRVVKSQVSRICSLLSQFFSNTQNDQDLDVFLEYIKSQLVEKLSDNVATYRFLKSYAVVVVKMSRECENGETEYIYPHFRSNCLQLLKAYDVERETTKAFGKTKKSYDEFNENGSGFTRRPDLKRIVQVSRKQNFFNTQTAVESF
ncbi:uncharacterized protein LOC118189802 isoform X2 [Stegodyphus dumicola]|uniref:uncharacterized protein LOC118189802 isoform X2 n=1 Tax=Stegodyphus dumicola TaxID=202533 RepID=UPI0015A84C5C|nr:uncharacterized protein LOC118189802 isoform X2 [Stegodyphus dumicola]